MVSVIITTCGANERLIRAIRSVLNQSYRDFEIIVVDDNSPQSKERLMTEQMMNQFTQFKQISYIKHKVKLNGSYARNTGISSAHGEYITFLDDDDFILCNRIKNAVSYLETHPSYSGVCMEVVKLKGTFLTNKMDIESNHVLNMNDILLSRAGIGSGSNIFLKKEVFKSINGFDVSYKRKQDIEFMLRVIKRYKVVYLKDVQIVKDISGVRKLNFEDNLSAFNLFNSRFKADIDALPRELQNLYFKTNYLFIYNVSKLSGDPQKITVAIQYLMKYDKSIRFSKTKIFLISVLYNLYNYLDESTLHRLLQWAKNRRLKEIDFKIRESLPQDLYRQIISIANWVI